MAVIHELLSRVEDVELRSRLEDEINKISKQKKFGLVFEEHLPECTPLYDIPVKKGSVVAKKSGAVSDMFEVLAIHDAVALCANRVDKQTEEIPVSELVCVAQFGEPIYPYLKPIDSVCNAPDSNLWHTLIEADNYHALQLLEYLYAGRIDCIYIDPPYNTGARDWKYNNDYVDGNDTYRHSKWLSMMEKRLSIAKRLLNPKDSVLIVTIDEKEYLHLGCLLEEIFSGANIQMISSVISPRGATNKSAFTRVDEYIFYVFIGNASIVPFGPDMLMQTEYEPVEQNVWKQMIRGSENGPRTKRPKLFYPIFFNLQDGQFNSVGMPPPLQVRREDIPVPEGCFAVYPIRRDGLEVTWALQPETFLDKVNKGYIRFGKWKPGDTYRTMAHLQKGTMERIEKGEIEILGRDDEGTVILGSTAKPKRPVTIWNMPTHDAGVNGKNLLTTILPACSFIYPKSLYAVKDTLNFIVKEKKDALIVDFFAGSGTTLHAVNLLNAEDGGHRRCIMVTNNEVSADESKQLSNKGFKPGDDEWEKLGIARFVTWPRTVCSILGRDANGNRLKGEYMGIERPLAEGFSANATFFKLGFLDKTSISLGRQLAELFPVLWMKAGAIGPCPTPKMDDLKHYWLSEDNRMGILINTAYFSDFEQIVNASNKITTVFIITDYESEYQTMRNNLQTKETYQLYRDYLDNFRINQRR
ncbi:MAG: site-specific DNA-methyltransferase [Clostridiales bacterium]|nr:site-specific DNA-methyltransferase [Clostridiales bacterium]